MKNNNNNKNSDLYSSDLYSTDKDLNKINMTTKESNLKSFPIPYKFPMTCPPVLFEDFNNLSKFDDKTSLYPKGRFSKSIKLKNFFFNTFGFTSAREILGGGPLYTSKKNTKIFAKSLNKTNQESHIEGNAGDRIESVCSYQESSLLGDSSAINLLFSKQPYFRKSDFALSNNNIGLNMVNSLMKLPCQINVPFFKYVIENLSPLVQVGLLPPLLSLEMINSNNIKTNKKQFLSLIETWYDFHNRLLALNKEETKTKIIFTGKEVRLTDNNLPHSLDKKLEKVLFKNKKSACLSLQGISDSFSRSLQMSWFFINTPLFFSMKFDTRGRIYYKNEFSPLQRPFGRHLIRFIKPSLIKTGSKEEFIFFSELGMAIKEHSCYKEAFAFVCENKDEIIQSLKNFSWTTFKKPWASLDFILEFQHYFSYSEQRRDLGIELFIQLELDASSSVMQVNSVLSKNTFLAKSVNLLPTTESISNKKLLLKKQPVSDSDSIKSIENLKVLDIYSLTLKWYQDYMLSGGGEKTFSDLLEKEIQGTIEKHDENPICSTEASLKENSDLFSEDLLDDIPKKSNKTKSTINLSDLLKDFVCNLDRPSIKSYLMTKSYNKGREQLAQDFYETISLMEIQKGSSLIIAEDNYQPIKVEIQNLLAVSYNPVDSLIQKKEKNAFLTNDLSLHRKVQSVKDWLPISIYNDKEPQQNQERFIFNEDSLPSNSLTYVRKLEQSVRDLQETVKRLEKNKNISDLKNNESSFSNNQINDLKDQINQITEKRALLLLNHCVNIESNFLWVQYFFKKFFSELRNSNNKNVSLEEFEERLRSLQVLFKKRTDYSNFLSIDSTNTFSKVETNSTKISYNTTSLKKKVEREKIFIEILEILIKKFQTLQKREFKQIVSKLITKFLDKICQERLRDVFINSEIISLLAHFVSTRNCCFTVNCFTHASYKTYYSLLLSNTYYFADDLTKKQNEKIQKKRVKIGYYGETADPTKSFTASPANFIQSCDGEILRNVVSSFVDQFPGKGILVRHDAFVVDCSAYFDIQNLYKESFLKVFFKKDAVSKGLKTKKVFLRVFHEKENLIKETGTDLNNTTSPLFIFQILIISNLFSLLDLSEKSCIEKFKVTNKKSLKMKNRKVKLLLLEFLYEPSFKSIDIFLKSVQDTVLHFNFEEPEKDLGSEKKEIDQDSIKKRFKDELEEDLDKKIARGNNLIKKWVKESQTKREEVELSLSIVVEQKKSTGEFKKKQQKIKLLEKKIKTKKDEIDEYKKQKKEIPERICTKGELLEFQEKLDSIESNKKQKEYKKSEKKYMKFKKSTAIKKCNLKPTLPNILIRYSLIYDKLKSNNFSCNDLLSLTRALS